MLTHAEQRRVLWKGENKILQAIVVLKHVVAMSQSFLIATLQIVGNGILPASVFLLHGKHFRKVSSSTIFVCPRSSRSRLFPVGRHCLKRFFKKCLYGPWCSHRHRLRFSRGEQLRTNLPVSFECRQPGH